MSKFLLIAILISTSVASAKSTRSYKNFVKDPHGGYYHLTKQTIQKDEENLGHLEIYADVTRQRTYETAPTWAIRKYGVIEMPKKYKTTHKGKTEKHKTYTNIDFTGASYEEYIRFIKLTKTQPERLSLHRHDLREGATDTWYGNLVIRNRNGTTDNLMDSDFFKNIDISKEIDPVERANFYKEVSIPYLEDLRDRQHLLYNRNFACVGGPIVRAIGTPLIAIPGTMELAYVFVKENMKELAYAFIKLRYEQIYDYSPKRANIDNIVMKYHEQSLLPLITGMWESDLIDECDDESRKYGKAQDEIDTLYYVVDQAESQSATVE